MTESTLPTQYKISLEWDRRTGGPDWGRVVPLSTQLDKIPAEAESLLIHKDVPTDDEWEMMGERFPAIKYLEVDAGRLESLNDCMMPLEWPLERLIMSSSCAEVTETEFILEGLVHHLVLLLTAGIRFEGPTTHELLTAHEEAVKCGDKAEHHISDTGFTITSVPVLVEGWMREKHGGKSLDLTPAAEPAADSEPINLTCLEILENDSIETLIRFALALPDVIHNLRTLNIRSANGCDLRLTGGGMVAPVLASLSRLETLVLTLGDACIDDISVLVPERNQNEPPDEEGRPNDDVAPLDSASEHQQGETLLVEGERETKTVPGFLVSLYKSFPPNLRTLRLRLPTSLTEKPVWEEWVRAFSSPEYLPHLSTVSLACDIACEGSGRYHKDRTKIADSRLSAAKMQVQRLIDAVQAGRRTEVKVEPFAEMWSSRHHIIDDVDERWYQD